MRNIFPEKSNTKCGGKTSPRPFSEKSKFGISLDQYFKVLYSLFLLHADHLPLPKIKLFKKTKRGLELVFLPYFLHDF